MNTATTPPNLSSSITQLHFDPAISMALLITLGLIALTILVTTLLLGASSKRKAFARLIVCALLMLALLNPSILEKQRTPIKDVAVIVIDNSMSQTFGDRTAATNAARDYLTKTIGALDTIDLRVIHAPANNGIAAQTYLFDALDNTLNDIPENRRAGVILVTDGQVHDIPQTQINANQYGPIHVLLSGDKNEKDRRIALTHSPAYGIVGSDIEIKYLISQTKNITGKYAAVTLNRFDGKPEIFDAPIGIEQTITLPVTHAGDNIFSLSVSGVPHEITLANNQTSIQINGVRDRLKTLLVSGKPHAGGRSWRDLLTSDPGVDLVHFTILREPDMIDTTPQDELALIAFPFRELFEIKLYDFDLIIFDRFTVNRILPTRYFTNIANYVREGGALLESSGPGFADIDSIYYTDIGDVLPAAPNGDVITRAFKPHVTALGRNHPVTENLDQDFGADQTPSWGHWYRQLGIIQNSGDTVMTGANDAPLLILDRVEKGRVAQLASDQIWLWGRGYDGGGPHAQLLRRVVHWLMKEPELDERALKIAIDEATNTITIRSRDPKAQSLPITMTTPDGINHDLELTRDTNGYLETAITATQLGIYAFSDTTHEQKKFVIIGEQNPPELRDILTTADKLAPTTDISGGGILWLQDTPAPKIRTINKSSNRYAGHNWLALRSNQEFNVTNVTSKPFLPLWGWLIVLSLALIGAWWWEGKTAKH